jgi:outer membrane lipoprotein-sorting protein
MPRALTLVFCFLALVSAAQTPDAGIRMMKLARHRVVAAKFVQTRHLNELDMSVEARGSMVSELDGRLRWQVDSPVRSVTVIDREKLTHFDGETGKLAVLEQEKFPWLKMLRSALDDWLSGDPERLARRFDVTSPRPDTLHLVPRDAALRKLCQSVDITLAEGGDAIRLIRITEVGGDTLEIRFFEVVNDPALPPDIWRMPPR